MLSLVCCLCLAAGPARLVLDDFEGPLDNWSGGHRETARVKVGGNAIRWDDQPQHASLVNRQLPHDWSGYTHLSFWLYSEVANGAKLTLVCNSENKQREGWDYYFLHFQVDWQGWKHFLLRFGTDLRPSREPLGWQQIDYVSLNSGGWQHHALPDTSLVLDDLCLLRAPAELQTAAPKLHPDGAACALTVTNQTDTARRFELRYSLLGPPTHDFTAPSETPQIAPGESAVVELKFAARPAAEPLTVGSWSIEVLTGDKALDESELSRAAVEIPVPLARRQHPCLFFSATELQAIRAKAKQTEWGQAVVAGLLKAGDAALAREHPIPDHGGQWGHHYVCQDCGLHLKAASPTEHLCPECGRVYTGWPYDDVYVSRIHGRNLRDISDLALAYAFSDDPKYLPVARELLLAYADHYPTYELHNVRGKLSNSAGRVYAQTLDEAVTIIKVAWAWDLIGQTDAFSADDRQHIENDLFREVAKTIRRNNGGISNWQSWHNAGLAAIGFALDDDELAAVAINGKSGLKFQLANSIRPDGFWYEGTAAYHFYALDALLQTAQMAAQAGLTVNLDPHLKSMFDAPLLYTYPDHRFPAVNDSDVFSLAGRRRIYEVAYRWYHDPAYLSLLHSGQRGGFDALCFGLDELPEAPPLQLASRDFEGLGAAVLRAGVGDDATYLHLDYGPHGGGHGHPDKLSAIWYGLGRELSPDPGRLAYGAPLHGSWYRQTIAHNTVVLNQTSQQPCEGHLTTFAVDGRCRIARGEVDTAYASAKLARTLALIERKDGPPFTIDVYEVDSVGERTIDYAWHLRGELTTSRPTTPLNGPLGDQHGYQHLEHAAQFSSAEEWQATWQGEQYAVRMTVLGEPGTTVFTGAGPGQPPTERIPAVVVRRQAERTTFVAVLEPSREAPQLAVTRVPVTQQGQPVVDAVGLRLVSPTETLVYVHAPGAIGPLTCDGRTSPAPIGLAE